MNFEFRTRVSHVVRGAKPSRSNRGQEALTFFLLVVIAGGIAAQFARGEGSTNLPKAFIDGAGPGWVTLAQKDFVHVNCKPETWSSSNGMIHCTGTPMGVIRSEKVYTNFELVA